MKQMSEHHLHCCSIIGAFFIANSIKDSVIVFNSPAGCEKNVLHNLCAHDIAGLDISKVFLNQIGDPEAVCGGEESIREKVKEISNKYPDKHIFIISSCVPEVIGEDVVNLIKKESYGSKVTVFSEAGFKGNLWQGYSSALCNLIENISSEKANVNKEGINLVGHLLDRLECDQLANIRILEDIFNGVKIPVSSLIPGSLDMKTLRRCSNASHNVVFEFGVKAAKTLKEKYKQENIYVDMPIGIEYTSKFVRKVANSFDRQDEAKKYIDKSLSKIIPKINALLDVFMLKRVGIFTDSQKMPGLVNFCIELGMVPVVICSHNESTKLGQKLAPVLKDKNAYINPDEKQIKDVLDELDLIIGSHVEKFKYGDKVPVYELSYPCFDRHCLMDDPYVGFEGAIKLANNLSNMLSMKNIRKFGISNELFKLNFENQLNFRL